MTSLDSQNPHNLLPQARILEGPSAFEDGGLQKCLICQQYIGILRLAEISYGLGMAIGASGLKSQTGT